MLQLVILFSINSKEYTVNITPTIDGEVTIDIDADMAIDIASNQNSASNQIKTIYDATVPVVEIDTTVPSNINVNNFNIIVMFSEDVTGF